MNHRKQRIRALFLSALASALLLAPFATASRFRLADRVERGPAEWLAVDGNRVAFGAGTTVHLGRGLSDVVVTESTEVAEPVLEAALLWNRLSREGRHRGPRTDVADRGDRGRADDLAGRNRHRGDRAGHGEQLPVLAGQRRDQRR